MSPLDPSHEKSNLFDFVIAIGIGALVAAMGICGYLLWKLW